MLITTKTDKEIKTMFKEEGILPAPTDCEEKDPYTDSRCLYDNGEYEAEAITILHINNDGLFVCVQTDTTQIFEEECETLKEALAVYDRQKGIKSALLHY